MKIWFNFVFASPCEINIFFKNVIQSRNQKPKKKFCLNGYPCWFFNKILNKFVSNITVDRSTIAVLII